MKIKEQRKGGERITIYGQIIFQGEDITNTKANDRAKKGIVLFSGKTSNIFQKAM